MHPTHHLVCMTLQHQISVLTDGYSDNSLSQETLEIQAVDGGKEVQYKLNPKVAPFIPYTQIVRNKFGLVGDLSLDMTPPCSNGITTPDISVMSGTDAVPETEVPEKTNTQPEKAIEGRPSTPVFIQNKVYTYNSLPSPSVQGKCKNNPPKKSVNEGVMSLENNLNPNAPLFMPLMGDPGNAATILKDIRIENLQNVIIGHLNINSLRYKFQPLVNLIQGNLDW